MGSDDHRLDRSFNSFIGERPVSFTHAPAKVASAGLRDTREIDLFDRGFPDITND